MKKKWLFNKIFVACATTVFAFLAGCSTVAQEPYNPRPEIKVGTWNKRYTLSEPIIENENIECDLYNIDLWANEMRLIFFEITDKHIIDIQRTYRLIESKKGSYKATYKTEYSGLHFSSDNNPIYAYTNTLDFNLVNTGNELFIGYGSAVSVQDDQVVVSDGATVTSNRHPFYQVTLIDGLDIDHSSEIPQRTWRIHSYTVTRDTETTLIVEEYVFHKTFNCQHDEAGNEQFYTYDENGDIIYEFFDDSHGYNEEAFYHYRYTNQNYQPKN